MRVREKVGPALIPMLTGPYERGSRDDGMAKRRRDPFTLTLSRPRDEGKPRALATLALWHNCPFAASIVWNNRTQETRESRSQVI